MRGKRGSAALREIDGLRGDGGEVEWGASEFTIDYLVLNIGVNTSVPGAGGPL
jgi:hypothetical protein